MKEQLKMLATSFALIFVAQIILKSIGQYNSVSFIVGGLVYAVYYAIFEKLKINMLKKQMKDTK